ncbi:sulfite exporter TauE/SafE family protein [Rhodococcus sp. JS3073]|uniref:sulfite exporter TauE/SafE family protein n=1 Tax=Rhodococcus sp. JS3073 TaxID=3002901 RepID=UPI002285D8E6|nr:sulfite exporter TauE/SafE family protein [Rhodococcus sp. JS3073]WAM18888.1 sulfite exporter TauE/SafE family protein [Rhodococcus sp. JS3073]
MFVLVLIGLLTGLTTVLFGFGGGFVTVPVVLWAEAGLGDSAAQVAVATSAAVMVVNAAVATSATSRTILRHLRDSRCLLALLGLGGIAGALLARLVPGAIIQWGFVTYLVGTIIDVILRPGFFRPTARRTIDSRQEFAIPTSLGLPIGASAAFLGVGGSVMTVPLLRRAGLGMGVATALANPMTLAISAPAALTFLADSGPGSPAGAALVGSVDVGAALALLLGALPVIVTLRRRPPRLPDRVHAVSYVLLLIAVTMTTVLAALR